MIALVECHSGFAYAERPVAVMVDGQRQAITAILAHWRSPQGRHFRVQTAQAEIFELVYDEAAAVWHIYKL
jgi:hypothetical protein